MNQKTINAMTLLDSWQKNNVPMSLTFWRRYVSANAHASLLRYGYIRMSMLRGVKFASVRLTRKGVSRVRGFSVSG